MKSGCPERREKRELEISGARASWPPCGTTAARYHSSTACLDLTRLSEKLRTCGHASPFHAGSRKKLCRIAREARREFEAGRAALPREKMINGPVVTKHWVDGRARVRTETSGQKRSGPTVNVVMTTERKP